MSLLAQGVRDTSSVPSVSDFASVDGTPVVVNTTTGACYVLTDDGVVRRVIGSDMLINVKDPPYNAKGDSTTNDTTAVQAAITAGGGRIVYFPPGQYKITTALTLPTAGTRLLGSGSGGDFGTYFIASDCAMFLVSSVHHSLLENFMIWPQGTTPPTTLITLENSYSIKFCNIRVHLASTYVPSVTAILQQNNAGGGCNDIVFDKFILRSDGTPYPIGFKFDNGCGSCTIANSDIETSSKAIEHLGGNITVTGTYMERVGGSRGINLAATSDANSSFTMIGGVVSGQNSGVPIAIDDGAKNVQILGTWVKRPDAAYQTWVYSLTNCSNIMLDYANYDPTKQGGSVALDPTKIQFRSRSSKTHETVTYSAAMTPTYSPTLTHSTASITATNATAFTVNVPSETLDPLVKPMTGSLLTVRIRNTSGGALGVCTWAAGYKLGAAWAQPATAFSRAITFEYDGTNWIECTRAAADVAN